MKQAEKNMKRQTSTLPIIIMYFFYINILIFTIMTVVKNNGTAVAVVEKVNEVVTAVVVHNPVGSKTKSVNIASDLIEPSNHNARKTFDADALK